MAQEKITQAGFEFDGSGCGLPGDLDVHWISEVSIDWPLGDNSTQSTRAGAENHKTFDPTVSTFHPVTIRFHANRDKMKKVADLVKKEGQGDMTRGTATVTVINLNQANQPVFSIDLIECALRDFAPGFEGGASSRAAMSGALTLVPARVEFKPGG